MKSIQNKLIYCFLLLTLVPVIFMGIFSYKISSDALATKLNIAVLNSIEMMEGYTKMADILQSLSRLLSRTIGKAGTVISVAEEIENINDIKLNYDQEFGISIESII